MKVQHCREKPVKLVGYQASWALVDHIPFAAAFIPVLTDLGNRFGATTAGTQREPASGNGNVIISLAAGSLEQEAGTHIRAIIYEPQIRRQDLYDTDVLITVHTPIDSKEDQVPGTNARKREIPATLTTILTARTCLFCR